MQLLAYFTAVTKGTDVDQPRNLAKSVTVNKPTSVLMDQRLEQRSESLGEP